jgi:hypothetical protein
MRQFVLCILLAGGGFMAGDLVGHSQAKTTTDKDVQSEREQWRKQFKADNDAISKCEVEKQILYGALESAKEQWRK